MVGRSGCDLSRTGVVRRGRNGAFGNGGSKVRARGRPALYCLHAVHFEPLGEFRGRGCHVARLECCDELGLPASHGKPRATFSRIEDRQDSAVRRNLQTPLRLSIEEEAAGTSSDGLLHMFGISLGGLSLLLVALARPTLIGKDPYI